MYKYYIFFAVLWILAVGSVIVAFTITGNPMEQKAMQQDTDKITKIKTIQSTVMNYAIDTNTMPMSLNQLKQKYPNIDIVDPDTNIPFEYTLTSSSEFKICSVFKADSSKNTISGYSYAGDLKYNKGFDCIPFKVQNFPVQK